MVPQPLPQAEPPRAGRDRWYLQNKLFVVALLLLLALVLLPAWAESGIGGHIYEDPKTGAAKVDYLHGLVKGTAIPWLLPAMGLVLVLRQRSIDLSVWVAFSLGAAAAARLIHAGCHPLGVLGAVAGVGAVMGGVHAWGVVRLRLPGWGVTLITATIGVSIVSALTAGQVVTVRTADLFRWRGMGNSVVMSGLLYLAALAAVAPLSARSSMTHKPGPAGRLAAALVASGVLSCLGGLCWVLKSGRSPMPGQLIGDLRVLAAAVLVGAPTLRRRGLSLLTCMLLPVAMLVATVWWLFVWPTPLWPVEVNLLSLAATVWVAHWAWVRTGPLPGIKRAWAVIAALGVLSLAATSMAAIPGRDLLRTVIGGPLWLIGAVGAAAERLKRHRAQAARQRRGEAP